MPRFIENTLPVANAVRATGVIDLRGIAAALNVRGFELRAADVGMCRTSRT